jgi:hypothetical protein
MRRIRKHCFVVVVAVVVVVLIVVVVVVIVVVNTSPSLVMVCMLQLYQALGWCSTLLTVTSSSSKQQQNTPRMVQTQNSTFVWVAMPYNPASG